MPSSLFRLGRFYLSLAISFSSFAGFILYSGSFPSEAFLCAAGVFLLSAGASAFNQYQERDRDARMDRTRTRPIPSGRISPLTALVFAVTATVSGSAVLLTLPGEATGWRTVLLGLLNLGWYTLVYTPLKTRSYFAVAAGAVNGAVPPMIGWVAAGGSLFDPKILFVALFIYIWQVPHFWLLLMLYADEYRSAGFFSLTDRLGPDAMRTIILVWVTATAVSTLFLPIFGIIRSVPMIIFTLTAAFLMVCFFVIILFPGRGRTNNRAGFIGFNLFMVLIFLAIIADQFMI
jgi:protoheme IX farnesyltransferase